MFGQYMICLYNLRIGTVLVTFVEGNLTHKFIVKRDQQDLFHKLLHHLMFGSFYLMHCPYNVEREPNVGICITTRCSLCWAKCKWKKVLLKIFPIFLPSQQEPKVQLYEEIGPLNTQENQVNRTTVYSAPVLVQVWIIILCPWRITGYLSLPSSH